MSSFHARCHCGNLELTFESNLEPARLPVRECSCSFCRKHGARTTTDPQGEVRITVHDSSLLNRYRFGARTADLLVCKRCGVYLAAVMSEGEKAYATLNVNAFDACGSFAQKPLAVNYDGEKAPQRRARRAANWTPVAAFNETGSHQGR